MFLGRNSRMAQSRRQVRPRSSRLYRSASFCATKPNKASMTLMLAAASIWATDALERHHGATRIPKLWTRASETPKTSRLSHAQIPNTFTGPVKIKVLQRFMGIGCSGLVGPACKKGVTSASPWIGTEGQVFTNFQGRTVQSSW